MTKRYIIKVSGRVQGVYFRHSTRQKARELGLKGFVRNEPDRSVYMEAEGPVEMLDQLLGWCHQGPMMARVEEVEKEVTEPTHGFEGFEVQFL